MKNIHFDIYLKLTDYKDNFSPCIKKMVALGIRSDADEIIYNEVIDVWSMKIRVDRNLKRKVW